MTTTLNNRETAPSEIVARYLTRTGLVAMVVTCYTFGNHKTFSYTGKHGAGSTSDKNHVQATIDSMLLHHKGIKTEIEFN